MTLGTGISLSATAASLVRSGLFGKDFESIVAEIVNFLTLRFGQSVVNNIVASEQGIVLIEMLAFGLSTAGWYIDRQVDDTTLLNVRLRAAAVAIARQLGYTARAATPPSVQMTVTLVTPAPTRLTIPTGTKLTGPNGLLFESVQQVVFDQGQVGPLPFNASEGQSLQAVFTSDGTPNQIFKITNVPSGKSISLNSIVTTIAAVQWQANEILTYEQINQYEFQYGFDPPQLLFGDGVAGNIPPKDAEIICQFFVTTGTSGSVAASSITAYAQPIAVNGQTIGTVLTQPAPSSTGSDAESINSIASKAPQVFQAAKRAVTQADLDAWISSFIDPSFGAVAIGRATVPHSVQQDAEALTIIQLITNAGVTADVVARLTNYWNSVLSSNTAANVVIAQILAADQLGRYIPATAGLASALETFLTTICESTVTVHVTDGSITLLNVNLTVAVKVLPDYVGQQASQAVVANVQQTLETILLGRAYGASLRISDLYQAVEGLDGVDYSNISISGTSFGGVAIPATRFNAAGDLPIFDYEVITLGALPVITLI